MAKVVISLDEQQITRLEQIIMDYDDDTAWELLREIRAKVRATQDPRCGIQKLRNYPAD